MPPCCGRGCKCPHLFCQLVEPDGTPPQWPNGDYLDPRGLLGLPAAFTAYLQTELRQPVKQQQIALEAAVERLTKIRSRLAARLAIRIIVTCSSLGGEVPNKRSTSPECE